MWLYQSKAVVDAALATIKRVTCEGRTSTFPFWEQTAISWGVFGGFVIACWCPTLGGDQMRYTVRKTIIWENIEALDEDEAIEQLRGPHFHPTPSDFDWEAYESEPQT